MKTKKIPFRPHAKHYTSRHLIRQIGSCCLEKLLVLQNSCVFEDEEGKDFNFLDLISVSFRTRKHSSRMRTARLPTVHVWWPALDVSSWGGWVPTTPGQDPCVGGWVLSPWVPYPRRDLVPEIPTPPSRGDMGPEIPTTHPLPFWTEWLTDASGNITFSKFCCGR